MFTSPTISSSSSIQFEHSPNKSVTYCECFGESGTEIVEDDSDDVLMRNVRIATL